MPAPIYLDYNATTPIDTRVLDAMMPYLTQHFGNAASSSHAYGWEAKDAVEIARKQVADLLKCSEKEIVFTSGATESINLAIKGTYEAKKGHIITVCTEHKAVLDTCKHLDNLGAEITYLTVDNRGLINLDELKSAIRPDTILVSIMIANNEIGVIQPVNEIAQILKSKNILFHTDATQAIGKIDFDIKNFDLLSFSGHKIYAPKGVGVLYAKRNTKIIAQQDGGKHERGMRSGTLNVPSIVALGKACEVTSEAPDPRGELSQEIIRIKNLRDKLEKGILQNIEKTYLNGHEINRLPNISNISFGGVDGENLLMSLNKIAVSNGSACNSASTEPSYVLKALGLSDDLAYSSVRFSLGRFTTDEDIDLAISHVKEVVEKLRATLD
jgi:cysteine desulfurase